jgi:hypothetical protein
MFELFVSLILDVPEFFLKYAGNLILRLFGRQVELDKDSFTAYAIGIVFWVLIIILIGIVIRLYQG